jgi:hypothetical protein
MVDSYAFATGDIKTICKRLGMRQAAKDSKTWNGTGLDGNFRQTYIHEHGDSVLIATGTARHIAKQLLFRDLKDMHDFLKDKKRNS